MRSSRALQGQSVPQGTKHSGVVTLMICKQGSHRLPRGGRNYGPVPGTASFKFQAEGLISTSGRNGRACKEPDVACLMC